MNETPQGYKGGQWDLGLEQTESFKYLGVELNESGFITEVSQQTWATGSREDAQSNPVRFP